MVGYIGKEPTVGNFIKLDSITTSATTTFNLLNGGVAYSPENARVCQVSLNGVIQSPETAYNIVGSTIVFSQALTSDDVIDYILFLGDVMSIGTPSDATVSTAKIVDNAVTTAKINNDAVTIDKINLVTSASAPSLEAKGSGSNSGKIILNCENNSHGVSIQAPSHSNFTGNYTLTLPTSDGNANELLKTDGSGVLSWGAVSSDWVKIIQTNVTSNVSNVDFVHGTGGVILDSTYRIYKLIGSYRGSTHGAEFQIRVINGGSNTRSSGYLNDVFRSYYSGGTSRASATDKIVRSHGGVQASTGQRANFEATFFNMSDADHNTTANCQFCAIDGSGETENQVNNGISAGVYATPEAHDGLSFSMSTGNVADAEFTLIGLKG